MLVPSGTPRHTARGVLGEKPPRITGEDRDRKSISPRSVEKPTGKDRDQKSNVGSPESLANDKCTFRWSPRESAGRRNLHLGRSLAQAASRLRRTGEGRGVASAAAAAWVAATREGETGEAPVNEEAVGFAGVPCAAGSGWGRHERDGERERRPGEAASGGPTDAQRRVSGVGGGRSFCRTPTRRRIPPPPALMVAVAHLPLPRLERETGDREEGGGGGGGGSCVPTGVSLRARFPVRPRAGEGGALRRAAVALGARAHSLSLLLSSSSSYLSYLLLSSLFLLRPHLGTDGRWVEFNTKSADGVLWQGNSDAEDGLNRLVCH
ncbi:hypothetical protein BHM03_00051939 [Ensete ventricosum]|nr:hypothetical protein BHM03_00051939 [Ensete ventricosum]